MRQQDVGQLIRTQQEWCGAVWDDFHLKRLGFPGILPSDKESPIRQVVWEPLGPHLPPVPSLGSLLFHRLSPGLQHENHSPTFPLLVPGRAEPGTSPLPSGPPFYLSCPACFFFPGTFKHSVPNSGDALLPLFPSLPQPSPARLWGTTHSSHACQHQPSTCHLPHPE